MSLLKALRNQVRRSVGRGWRLLRWVSKNAGALTTGEGNRLLIIYDLSSQPISIGDVLVMQVGALVLRELYNSTQIDFAFAYDSIGGRINPTFPAVTTENIAAHVSSLLSVVQVNPHFDHCWRSPRKPIS